MMKKVRKMISSSRKIYQRGEGKVDEILTQPLTVNHKNTDGHEPVLNEKNLGSDIKYLSVLKAGKWRV
jgi:hypothetical protein